MLLSTAINLQKIMDSDSSICCIEVWSRVLYVRRWKGRNTFMSKKGVTTEITGIYFNLKKIKDEYKHLQLKFHPDYNKSTLHLSQSLNKWKELLLGCDQREINAGLHILFNDRTSYGEQIEICVKGSIITQQQKNRYSYRCTYFEEYEDVLCEQDSEAEEFYQTLHI